MTIDYINELTKNAMGGTEILASTLNQRLPKDLNDAVNIIASRVRKLDPNRPNILWCHDLPEDPEMEIVGIEKERKQFAYLIFVSNWQMERFNLVRFVPHAGSFVIPNAIDPIPLDIPNKMYKQGEKIRLIYHTTPHRGLEILIPVFVELAKQMPFIHLDVYSSFELYGWAQRDIPYEPLFKICREHPQITYHGAVANSVVRDALQKAHIFAYPCIWKETCCLALIEAMSAGCICLHPNYSALPETSGRLTNMYQWDHDNNRHANKMYHHLMHTIQSVYTNKINPAQLVFNKKYIDGIHGWDTILEVWSAIIKSTMAKPTLQ